MSAAYTKAIGSYTDMRIYLAPVKVDMNNKKKLIENAENLLKEVCTEVICVDTGFVITDENSEKTNEEGRYSNASR